MGVVTAPLRAAIAQLDVGSASKSDPGAAFGLLLHCNGWRFVVSACDAEMKDIQKAALDEACVLAQNRALCGAPVSAT